LHESGVTGYEASVWYGLVAPARTPYSIIEKINTALMESLQDLTIREQMIKIMTLPPWVEVRRNLERFLQAETAKWAKVVKASGVRMD
jgi:tripartite-type tricarboxylate transporter receptor subunit TctC